MLQMRARKAWQHTRDSFQWCAAITKVFRMTLNYKSKVQLLGVRFFYATTPKMVNRESVVNNKMKLRLLS
ncbi:hypothetical protein SHVI106290_15860 [Shewanella violacea]